MFKKFGFGRNRKPVSGGTPPREDTGASPYRPADEVTTPHLLEGAGAPPQAREDDDNSPHPREAASPSRDNLACSGWVERDAYTVKSEQTKLAVDDIINSTDWDDVIGLINDDLAQLDADLDAFDLGEPGDPGDPGIPPLAVTPLPVAPSPSPSIVKLKHDLMHTYEHLNCSSTESLNSQLTLIADQSPSAFAESPQPFFAVPEVTQDTSRDRTETPPRGTTVQLTTNSGTTIVITEQKDDVHDLHAGDLDIDSSPTLRELSLSPSLQSVSVSSRINDFERSSENVNRDLAHYEALDRGRSKRRSVNSDRPPNATGGERSSKVARSQTDLNPRRSRQSSIATSARSVAKADSYLDVRSRSYESRSSLATSTSYKDVSTIRGGDSAMPVRVMMTDGQSARSLYSKPCRYGQSSGHDEIRREAARTSRESIVGSRRRLDEGGAGQYEPLLPSLLPPGGVARGVSTFSSRSGSTRCATVPHRRNALMFVTTGTQLRNVNNNNNDLSGSPRKSNRSLPRLGVSSVRSRPQSVVNTTDNTDEDDCGDDEVNKTEKRVTFESERMSEDRQTRGDDHLMRKSGNRRRYRDFTTVVIAVVWIFTVFTSNAVQLLIPEVVLLEHHPLQPPEVIDLGDTFTSTVISEEQTTRPLTFEALATVIGAFISAALFTSRKVTFNLQFVLAVGCGCSALGFYFMGRDMLLVYFDDSSTDNRFLWRCIAWSVVIGVGRGIIYVGLILKSMRLWSSHISTTTTVGVLYSLGALVAACTPYLVQPFIQGNAFIGDVTKPLARIVVGLAPVSEPGSLGLNSTGRESVAISRDPAITDETRREPILHASALLVAVGVAYSLFTAFHVIISWKRCLTARRRLRRGNQHRMGQLMAESDRAERIEHLRRRLDWKVPDYCARKRGGRADSSNRKCRDNGRLLADVVRSTSSEDLLAGDTGIQNLMTLLPGDKKPSPAMTTEVKRREYRLRRVTRVDASRCFARGHRTGIRTLLYVYVFFALPEAIERIFCRYVSLPVPESTAYASRTVFLLAACVSRLLVIVATRYVQPNFLVLGSICLAVASSVVITLYGTVYFPIHYTFTAIFGFCVGIFIPAGYTWANSVLAKSPLGVAVGVAAGGFGVALSTWLTSVVVDWRGGTHAAPFLVTCLICLSGVAYPPIMRHIASRKVAGARKTFDNETVYVHSLQNFV